MIQQTRSQNCVKLQSSHSKPNSSSPETKMEMQMKRAVYADLFTLLFPYQREPQSQVNWPLTPNGFWSMTDALYMLILKLNLTDFLLAGRMLDRMPIILVWPSMSRQCPAIWHLTKIKLCVLICYTSGKSCSGQIAVRRLNKINLCFNLHAN